MLTNNAFAGIGSLLGDPARASMMVALMDGRALTATELSVVAGVTPQTASSHIGQLVAAGLLAMERQGRHRYHRLAAPSVARMVETMMAVSVEVGALSGRTAVRTGPRDRAMRHARTCYDHLAGRVAVAVADAMLARGEVELDADGGALTAAGATRLTEMGIDLSDVARGRTRVFCRPCLDWSERRPHIAGRLGAVLLSHFTARSWIRLTSGSRTVVVTPKGQRELTGMFGLAPSLWDAGKD